MMEATASGDSDECCDSTKALAMGDGVAEDDSEDDGAGDAVGGYAGGGMSDGDGCPSQGQDSDAVEGAVWAIDVGGDGASVEAAAAGAVLGSGCGDRAFCISYGCSR